MKTTRSSRPRDWREVRRFRALELKRRGWKQRDIAEAMGVTRGAVSQWLKAAREGGEEALRSHPAPGPQPRLSEQQKVELPKHLSKGADYYGFLGEVWTTSRIAKLIRDLYGVSYHPAHVSRLLKEIGWSAQKPTRRATQRDEEAIEKWYIERWTQVKRGPRKKEEPSSG